MNHETHEIHETTFRLRHRSPLPPETEAIVTRTIGCAIAVHKALGPGFLESIYKKAMCIELALEQIHRAQVISYLHAIKQRAGLLINFRVPILPKGLERIVV